MENGLKPCPFCGSTDLDYSLKDEYVIDENNFKELVKNDFIELLENDWLNKML